MTFHTTFHTCMNLPRVYVVACVAAANYELDASEGRATRRIEMRAEEAPNAVANVYRLRNIFEERFFNEIFVRNTKYE